ncbi:MAG TPA: hypothetical protein VGF45_13005 [Polyangia bacterium]
MSEAAGLTTLLERLSATDIEFILVGGLAAVAQGGAHRNLRSTFTSD